MHHQLQRLRAFKNQRTILKAIHHTWEVFWITKNGKIEFISQGFEVLTGYNAGDFSSSEERFDTLLESITGGKFRNRRIKEDQNLELTTKSGVIKYVKLKTIPLGPRNTIHILEDKTKEHLEHQRLVYLTTNDGLTGAMNRQGIINALESAIRNTCLWVVVLDVDRFKEINDAYGHQAGNAFLFHLTQTIREALPKDANIARLGGDEFAILIPGIPPENHAISPHINRLLSTSREPFVNHGIEILSSCCIGYCNSRDHGSTAQDLLTNAHIALNQAKTMGRGQAMCYSTSMSQTLKRRLNVTRELAHALERGELRVVYQPQWNMNTRKIIGAEALLRWNHPYLGKINPDEFIPLAESSYLIHVIGEYVLWQACSKMQEWNTFYKSSLHIAVNVSPLQLKSPQFISNLRRILLETELPPHCLELEVTESSLMSDSPQTQASLEELRNMGVNLSLDDFGTEYSSFNYLHRFKLHKLKIDKLFVHQFLTNPNTESIVRTIIELGKTLEMRVLAEGVENESQMVGLRSVGCQEVQGYFLSKPLEDQNMESLFKELLTRGERSP